MQGVASTRCSYVVIPSTSAVRSVGSTPRTPSNAATSRPGVATSVRPEQVGSSFASRTGLPQESPHIAAAAVGQVAGIARRRLPEPCASA